MFEAHGVLSKEEAYDQIRNKWMVYQNEHIPQIFYVKIQKVKIEAVVQKSLWILLLNKMFSTQKSIYTLPISVLTTTGKELLKFMMKVVLKSFCGCFQQ